MTSPIVSTRAEWLTKRKALLVREKALTKQADQLAIERRALPWVALDSEYVFDSSKGRVSLSELFDKHSQLIVYHFMFGPEWEAGCVSCSFWADNFAALGPHLNARDISFVVVSRAPIEMIDGFRGRMGWKFEWVSSRSNSFNADFHVSFGSDHKTDDPVYYNFQDGAMYPADEAHGTSVFAKGEDDQIFHTYSTYGRGLEATNAAYSYIDMTPKGRDEPSEGNPMAWVRHHDNY